MVVNEPANRGDEADETDEPVVPRVFEWLVAAFVGVVGLAFALGGGVLLFAVDRDLIAEGVADGSIQSDFFTDAQMVDLTASTASWTGIGLVVVGVLLVGWAIVYGKRRYQEDEHADGSSDQFWTIVLVGSVVSVVASFLPFPQVIGGGTGGYLAHDGPGRVVIVGALSGLLPSLPLLAVGGFSLVGILTGGTAVQSEGLTLLVIAGGGAIALFSVTISAGLGAIGGYAGGWIAADQAV